MGARSVMQSLTKFIPNDRLAPQSRVGAPSGNPGSAAENMCSTEQLLKIKGQIWCSFDKNQILLTILRNV